jgi:TIR domain
MLRHGRGRPVCSSRKHHGLGGLSFSGRASAGSARLSGVFINYRREDSGGHAGRLYDRLLQRYGSDRVFRDIDAIAPGVDYAQRIEAAIGSCDAVIVLIGRDWLDVRGPDGRRRLDDPGDLLRREIAAALARGILVIPVLVEGATMPSEQKLPSDIAPFARRNALELSDTRWDYDVDRLQQTLDQVVEHPPPVTAAPAATLPERSWYRAPLTGYPLVILIMGLLAIGVYFGGRFILDLWLQATREVDMTISPTSGPSGTTVTASGSGFQPGETIELRVHTDRVAEIRADRSGGFFDVRFQVRDPLGGSFPSDRQIVVSATGRSSIKHAEEPFQLRS